AERTARWPDTRPAGEDDMAGSRISTIPACRIKPGTLRAPSQNYAKAVSASSAPSLPSRTTNGPKRAAIWARKSSPPAGKAGHHRNKREWRDSRGYWCLNRHRSRGGILIHHLLGRGPSSTLDDLGIERVSIVRAGGR